MVNIFIYAMQMEKDGEDYYYQLAQQTANEGLRTILEMLAAEEAGHYRIIDKMRAARPDMAVTTILSDAKNVFVQIMESNESFDFDLGQTDLYRKAQDLEKKSEEFYLEKASAMGSDVEKEILQKIAAEEKQHYMILENIIEFVSRPANWLENAEWHHLDNY